MKCKCGYTGRPEFGTFQSMDIPGLTVHMRCPQCESSHKPVYTSVDMIELQMRYPESCEGWSSATRHAPEHKIITFIAGQELIGYSITCPVCQFGHASAVTKEEYDYLRLVRELLSEEAPDDLQCDLALHCEPENRRETDWKVGT